MSSFISKILAKFIVNINEIKLAKLCEMCISNDFTKYNSQDFTFVNAIGIICDAVLNPDFTIRETLTEDDRNIIKNFRYTFERVTDQYTGELEKHYDTVFDDDQLWRLNPFLATRNKLYKLIVEIDIIESTKEFYDGLVAYHPLPDNWIKENT